MHTNLVICLRLFPFSTVQICCSKQDSFFFSDLRRTPFSFTERKYMSLRVYRGQDRAHKHRNVLDHLCKRSLKKLARFLIIKYGT